MKISIIICSYNRPLVLPVCLKTVEAEAALYSDIEIVLVHRLSDTATAEAMRRFAAGTVVPVKIGAVERAGLSAARNTGVAEASGDLLIFTDDDCLMQSGYIGAVVAGMEENPGCSYGGGGVHDAETSAPGATHIRQKAVIGPRTLIGAGVFSGCNMFFRREVFEKIGLFREDMGAGCGMSFVGAEDLEMTTRANFSGMSGVLIPGAVIVHDHQRKAHSKELHDLEYSYNVSRGSFYAYMMMHGVHEIWQFWANTASPDANRKISRQILVRLQQEFYGAAEYLGYCLKNNVDLRD